jgi:hypothetical protein
MLLKQRWAILQDPSVLAPATSKTHQKALGPALRRTQYCNVFFFSFFFHMVKRKYYYIIVIVIVIINKFKEKKGTTKKGICLKRKGLQKIYD